MYVPISKQRLRALWSWLANSTPQKTRQTNIQNPVAIRPVEGITFLNFIDGAVLFSASSQRLWALNTTFTCIWCLLYECDTIEEVTQRLSADFGVDPETALRDVIRVATELTESGLLVGSTDPITAHSAPPPELLSVNKGEPLRRHLDNATTLHVELHGLSTRLQVDDPALAQECERIFSPQLAPDRANPNMWMTVTPASKPECFDIYVDSLRAWEGLPRNEVTPYLSGLIFVRCMEVIHDRLLFHSGVLALDGNAIILPGEAGSGKSTLCTLLAHQGWTYLTDELAIVTRDSIQLEPIPMSIKLKPGSFEIASRFVPDLETFPIHFRIDQKYVRFINPPAASLPKPGQAFAPRAIVFPTHAEGAATTLNEIDKYIAIQRLFHNRVHTRNLELADVETLIKLVEQTPCYTLTYAENTDTLPLLHELVTKPV